MLLGERYKLESDSFNVSLYKRVEVKKTGGTRWKPIAYFSSPHNALRYLVGLELMETGMADLKTVVKKQEELYTLINSLRGMPERVQRCTRHQKGK